MNVGIMVWQAYMGEVIGGYWNFFPSFKIFRRLEIEGPEEIQNVESHSVGSKLDTWAHALMREFVVSLRCRSFLLMLGTHPSGTEGEVVTTSGRVCTSLGTKL